MRTPSGKRGGGACFRRENNRPTAKSVSKPVFDEVLTVGALRRPCLQLQAYPKSRKAAMALACGLDVERLATDS
jgi:hypothetical protein